MATKTNTQIHGSEYYRIRRTINGRQKSFYGKSKGDAEKKYRAFVEEEARRKHRPDDTATFSDRADEFISQVLFVSQKYAEGTKQRYESCYRCHIKGSFIDKMQVGSIRPADVQRFYNSLDVSQSTLKAVNKFMSIFNKWLVRNDYAGDFISAVEIPKKHSEPQNTEIITWSEDEIAQLHSALELSGAFRLRFLVYVLLYTGARISEALSLRYSDIEDGVIHIQRQYYMHEIKPPKYNSVRDVPIHQELSYALIDHKTWHEREMKRKGYDTDYIFTTSNGNLYSASSVRKQLIKFCEKAGVEFKKIHAFRATFCTQMCKCGVPLEVTSALLGHKSLEVTAKHYALIKQDSKEQAINQLHY